MPTPPWNDKLSHVICVLDPYALSSHTCLEAVRILSGPHADRVLDQAPEHPGEAATRRGRGRGGRLSHKGGPWSPRTDPGTSSCFIQTALNSDASMVIWTSVYFQAKPEKEIQEDSKHCQSKHAFPGWKTVRGGKAGGLRLRLLLHPRPHSHPPRRDCASSHRSASAGATKIPATSENIHIAELASSRTSG